MSENRKIAAILAADVVGFSRLTGADEDRTLARLRALRSDLIDPTISVHRGRVVGMPAQAKAATPVEPKSEDKGPARPALPDKPSIAVLPFQNMSDDRQQDYFVDGMVEDITTGLSRIKWLFVIARNSSFVYKGKAVDVRQVGRELGVRYVLEGGVRKAGNRLRITAQLIEAESGAHLWADRFDGALDDVFELQDQITDKVIGIVEPSLQRSEIERSRRKPPENLDAYDLYLRAVPHTASRKLENARIAAGFLEDALKLDPNYAAVHALLALCRQMFFIQGGLDEADKLAGLRHALAAIAGAGDDASALAAAALVIGHLGWDHEAAIGTIRDALAINPSSATAHYFAAHIFAFSGDYATATVHADRALRLSPFDPLAFEAHTAFAIAALHEGRFAEAASGASECRLGSLHLRAGGRIGFGGTGGRRPPARQTAFAASAGLLDAGLFPNGIGAGDPGSARRRGAAAWGAGIVRPK
ncbi:MAG: transcriptional regulator [Roseiarcus sp.]